MKAWKSDLFQAFFFVCMSKKTMAVGMNQFLIVGLGNPGEEYRRTRHNVGFSVVEELVMRWSGGGFKNKWQAEFVSLKLGNCTLHLVKPQSFMNRSGKPVATFCNFFKLTAEQLLVIHDDLDMNPGRIKLVKGGGAGGHNGIKSIAESIGSREFNRLKLGIGRPGKGGIHKGFPVEKYVLSNFDQVDLETFSSRYDAIEDGVRLLVEGETGRAMTLLNSLK